MNALRTIAQKQAAKLLTSGLLIGLIVAAALFSGGISKAASTPGPDSLSLSPASGSYNTGSTFTVSIYENSQSSGNHIGAAEADLLFNASQLQYMSSTDGTAFGQYIGPTVTSSEFTLAGAVGGAGLTGTNLLGTVTFKTLVGSGTAAITFGSQSSILTASGNESWNQSTAAGSYTLTTPAPPPSSGGGGSSGSSGSSGGSSGSSGSTGSTGKSSSTATSGPAKTSSGSTTATTTTASAGSSPAAAVTAPATTAPTASNPAPVISDVAVSDVTKTSVTISWHTSLPATSVVQYGTSSKYGLTTQDNTLVTSHQLILSEPNIAAATRYQFVIMSVSSAGVGATSAAGQFTTLGFPVTIRVVDAHGKLIKGAKVSADGQTQTTNAAGFVTFQNLSGGIQSVVIKAGNKTTKRTITVNGTVPATGSGTLQQFSLSAARGTTNPIYYLITVVIIMAAAGGALFMPRSRLMHGFPMAPATAGADPDIHGTAGPIVDESSIPIVPTSSMGGVSAIATHEPGEVIAPSSSQPAGPTSSSGDTASSGDNSDDPSSQGPVAAPPAPV